MGRRTEETQRCYLFSSMSHHRTPPNPTAEQQAVATHPLMPGHLVQVEAYAGTGKTTTLELVARRHAGRRILYLCFNKANAVEGTKRMPSNVTSTTVHGLAYRAIGWRYAKKLGELRARELMDVMGLPDSGMTQMVIQTFSNFLRTDKDVPDLKNVPPHCLKSDATRVVVWVERMWRRMQDIEDTALLMTHDGYLKMWLQTKPILRDYDLLLVDEAQDLEPQALSLALRQQECGQAAVILVGDTHQAIYSWRGATNAMETCAKLARDRFSITECFRFPQAHADAAAAVLKRIKNIAAPLKGRGNGAWSGEPSHAILARTNARLIHRAMAVKGRLHFAATDGKAGFSPFGPYRFQEMLDVLSIYQGKSHQVKTPYLRRFHDYEELREFATGDGATSQDVELLSLAKMAEEFSNHLPLILDGIVRASGPRVAGAVCLSSGHRAKGLEWDRVEVENDFIPVYDSEALTRLRFKMSPTQIKEEANLLYVALTRARCRLDISIELDRWLRHDGIILPKPDFPALRVAAGPEEMPGSPAKPAKRRAESSSAHQGSASDRQTVRQGEFTFAG